MRMLKGIFNQTGETSKNETINHPPTFQQRVGFTSTETTDGVEPYVSEMISELSDENEESSFGKVFEKLNEVIPSVELNESLKKESDGLSRLEVGEDKKVKQEVATVMATVKTGVENVNQVTRERCLAADKVVSKPMESDTMSIDLNVIGSINEDESPFALKVDEWELYMLTEGLKLLIKDNEARFHQLALDEEIQVRQENQRLAFLIQQFEIKRLGKKRALKQLMTRLSLQLDEAKTDQDLTSILTHLVRLAEMFE